MMLPKICTVLALLSSLLITSVIAQSPIPTPVPARRANTDTDTNTKTTDSKTSTPTTTSSHNTNTKSSTATDSPSKSTSTPSATSSPTSTSAPSSSSSLSTGAIAGIAVGVVAAVALVAAGFLIYIWRMRKSRQVHRQSMNPRGTLGGVTPITETAPMNNMYKSINDESTRSTDASPTAEGDVEAYGALGAAGIAGSGGEGQSNLDPAATAGDRRVPSVETDGTERPAVTPQIATSALPNSPVELGTSP